jgi:hypothetical protein
MENQEQEQSNGHSLLFSRQSSGVNAYRHKRLWREKPLETLDLLNNIKLEETATSEHNIQVYEAIREKLRMLKMIDPEKKIHQDTLVETTVIKYDCPMCLPTDDSDYELEPKS